MLLWFTIGLAGERPGVILADSSHPLVLACTSALGESRLTECVERTARRNAAAAEVAACEKFGEPKAINDLQ